MQDSYMIHMWNVWKNMWNIRVQLPYTVINVQGSVAYTVINIVTKHSD